MFIPCCYTQIYFFVFTKKYLEHRVDTLYCFIFLRKTPKQDVSSLTLTDSQWWELGGQQFNLRKPQVKKKELNFNIHEVLQDDDLI